MNAKLFIMSILLTPFILFSADLVEQETYDDFYYETDTTASDFFKIQHDIIEFKNYLQEDFHIRLLDEKRGLMAPEKIIRKFRHTNEVPSYDYVVPAAQGSNQEEPGYARIKLPKNTLTKTFTVIIFLAHKEDGAIAKAKDFLTGQELRTPVAQFTVQADPERKRCLLSIKRSKSKIQLCPQKGRQDKGVKKTISGISKDRNVKTKDIGKNIIR